MSNIAINITENGTTTLATAGKYCDRNIDVSVDVAGSGGGSSDLPEEAFNLSGTFDWRFVNDNWTWFIDAYGDKVTTNDITSASQCFLSCAKLTTVPFDLNFKGGTANYSNCSAMFRGCQRLTDLPNITGLRLSSADYILGDCYLLREIPEGFYNNWDFSYLESLSSLWSGAMNSMFYYCMSLRQVPREMIASGNKMVTYSYSYFYYGFYCCHALDELIDLPLYYASTWTSNAFFSSFDLCNRLKELTFEKNEDGTPKTMKWKNQTIDLSLYVGYLRKDSNITNYNSGLTKDTLIYADETMTIAERYQLLKDNPDSWTASLEYSRYNHDSAVNTINSLPDTSAYLATAGGTNTIKFKGASGSLTDGGAINTLTEEEIAVATAKGWTVTLV